MIGWLLLAVGLVACAEGLVLALAPGRVEDLMKRLAGLPVEARRLLGLTALVVAVILITAARTIGIS